ncbi:MAG: hypothetical protein NT062_29625 [Proteobacteria bacterium]|nr:hypothetical protein [Pseudomonadota bacterium]
MKRTLMFGAVVVVLAVVVLVWKLRGSDVVSTTSTSGATAVPVDDPPASPNHVSTIQTPDRPPITGRTPGVKVGPAEGSPTITPSTEYQVGNVTVRDHRGSNHAPMDIPINLERPDGRKVSSTLVSEISQKMRAVLAACAKEVPPEARGPKPRMEGEITIAIKDHQVTVSSTVIRLTDVVGAAVDPTQQCLEKGALAVTHVAPDEADVASYQINLSYAILP